MKRDALINICQKCKATWGKLGGPCFTKREMQRVLVRGYADHFVEINAHHFELKSKEGICPYLTKDYTCLIHKFRPIMCRCWPIYINRKKELFLVDCPLASFLSDKEIAIMKKQASRIPKKFLSDSDQKLIRKKFKISSKKI